jgi:hypothetical protein
MKSKYQHALVTWIAPAIIFLSGPRLCEAGVVTYIDLLDSAQALTNSSTNTIVSANSIGGYRTMALSVTGSAFPPTFLYVDDTSQQLSLATPGTRVPSFEVKWGGAGGTNGLGGIDMTGGATNFTLFNSFLNFTIEADLATSVTWTFIDTLNNVASYAQAIPANPAITYAISLSSFSGAGVVQWTNINFITLSGGGTPGLDLTLSTPITLAAGIPEPGTWAAAALLLGVAAHTVWRRRCKSLVEAPAAA